MKTLSKITLLYLFFSLTYAVQLAAQPIKINEVISQSASSKLHYKLALSIMLEKDLMRNKLISYDAKEVFNNRIKSLAKSIVINSSLNEPTVNVLIRITKGSLINHDFFIKHKRIEGQEYSYITATILIKNIEFICELENVLGVEPSFKMEALLDESASNIHADDVWNGNLLSGLDDLITGEGVFIGIIDSKPTIDHSMFTDENNKTRFISIFDYNSLDISLWPEDIRYHGTHVAGIAAGGKSNNSTYRGIAPGSKVMWYPNYDDTNNLLHALDTMKKVANGNPLVINNSNGIFEGPRDGSLELERNIDDMLTGNVIWVNAAGNQSNRGIIFGKKYLHFQGFVSNEISDFIEIKYHVKDVNGNTSTIEIWHDNKIDVQVLDNDILWPESTDIVKAGEFKIGMQLDKNSNDSIAIFNFNNNFNNRTRPNYSTSNVTSIIFNSKDGFFEPGDYRIRIYPNSNNDAGIIDAYLCHSGHSIGGFEDGDNYQTVASPGLAKKTLCVASHLKNSQGGDIGVSSSLGPLRNDNNSTVSKPDIAAPGVDIYSADYQDIFSYIRKTGTSMAAPHVTGAIALLMQCFPQLTATQVKEILQKSANSPFTDKEMDIEDKKYWGAGKLNILEAFKSMVGFSYVQPFAYDSAKYKSAFKSNPKSGLPYAPVNYNWNNINFSYQKFTNGAIFSDNREQNAYWMGEGIWSKWINLEAVNSHIGLPICSEFIDENYNNYPTVLFQKGKIHWNGIEAIVSSGVTYNVKVPVGTNACYIAGTFNNWDTSANPMVKVDDRNYTVTITNASTIDTYKYVCGPSWAYQEKGVSDEDIPNRTYAEYDEVIKWAKIYNPNEIPIDIVYKVIVPSGTRTCFISGGMTNWSFREMDRINNYTYSITLKSVPGSKYKYCSGPDWIYEELDIFGNPIADREWSEEDHVLKWKSEYEPDDCILPLINTKSIEIISETSLRSGGEILMEGNYPISGCGICWNTTGNPSLSDNHTFDIIENGTFTSTINNLMPNTEYFVRAYANGCKTTYGNEISFKSSYNGLSSISGKIFNDINYNGIYDENIDKLQSTGWSVQLQGPINKTVTPSYDGFYKFEELPAGNYVVSENVPHDWTVISPFWNGKHTISLSNSENVSNKNFANFYLLRDNSDAETLIFPNGQNTGRNDIIPMSKEAPKQSSPLGINDIPVNAIHLKISATGVSPDTFYVKRNSVVQLAVTSTDNSTHALMFDDQKLSAVAIGVSPNETRLITFKAYSLNVGDIYSFRCDVPGHAARGETGRMIVQSDELSTPFLTTQAIESITATSAVCGGNIITDNGSPVSSRGVCWNKNGNPSINDHKTENGVGKGSYSSKLYGLQPSTKYYARAYATNSLGISYGNQVSFTTSGLNYNEVVNPITGRIWLDRNLGANRVAINSTDQEAFGDLYQWGRGSDGHEKRTSATTTILSTNANPHHSDFIISYYTDNWMQQMEQNLWQGVNGTNNPCPDEFRIPTTEEWLEEIMTWPEHTSEGAFTSALKLTSAGSRYCKDGLFYNIGNIGHYWTSSLNGNQPMHFFFIPSYLNFLTTNRAEGMSIRCIKDYNTDFKEITINNSISIFPNPVKNELYIECNEYSNIVYFEVINFMGQIINNGKFTGQNIINTSNLLPGVYMVKIVINELHYQKKIIKE